MPDQHSTEIFRYVPPIYNEPRPSITIVMLWIYRIFVVLSSTVSDMKDSDHNGIDALLWWYHAREEDEASPDARRRKSLLARDPVH
ncbi:hypothetical protein SmJEL517_g03018 [Synchytrium microbalum]|uniref:Uncharacterized protein n=1 Tax=Synchytrium microbalum TaxID=1806994 RepID=A0A507C5C1_9FUNG|nr:uncharacterized protein SmJEL517_g03018 [Synchytrium microbalum]TPX34319.1 hypothetical protein SmJEL517_g03018 [Synchytrium microbalum]